MAEENQITDDDWAAAMQEQAAAETGDSETDSVFGRQARNQAVVLFMRQVKGRMARL